MGAFGSMGSDAASGAGLGSMGGPVGAGIGAGAGALFGLGDYFLFKKPEQRRQLALAAETQRYSPWTKLKADAPGNPDPLGSVLSMGSAGAQLGQNVDQANQANKMNNTYLQYLQNYTAAPTAMPQASGSMPYGYQPQTPLPPGGQNFNPQYGGWK